mmetsp:Transcript_10967/g.16119  ORF Transcript_10967/g.16119 Transcript_10967/m.16119 type:complete len:398 (+) Transcript_10967:80-1273(+)
MKFFLCCLVFLYFIVLSHATVYKGKLDLGSIVKMEYTTDTENNKITFIISGKHYNSEKTMSRWFGFGVSPNAKGSGPGMADASITVVNWPENATDPIIKSYTGIQKNGRPAAADLRKGYEINLSECSLTDNSITISFSRPLSKLDGTPEEEVFHDILPTKKTHIIWAYVDGTTDLSFHGRDFGKNVGSDEIDFYKNTSEEEENVATTIFEYLHGFSMITAWLILATAGTYVGRYHRRSLKKEPGLRGCLCWYVTHHVVLMIGSVIFTFLGFIFIIIRQSTYLPANEIFDVWSKPHTMLGIVIIISVLFQVLLGSLAGWLFNERKKSLIAKFHWFVGRALWISGFINVYLGMTLVGAHTASYMLYYLWTAAVVGLFVFTTPEVESPVETFEEEEKPFL